MRAQKEEERVNSRFRRAWPRATNRHISPSRKSGRVGCIGENVKSLSVYLHLDPLLLKSERDDTCSRVYADQD